MYTIFDNVNGVLSSRRVYKSRRTANRIADRLNLEYGSYRYYVSFHIDA